MPLVTENCIRYQQKINQQKSFRQKCLGLCFFYILEDVMIGDTKEVYYHKYCNKCKHLEENESNPESACWDCLEEPTNENSHKPLYFEPAE